MKQRNKSFLYTASGLLLSALLLLSCDSFLEVEERGKATIPSFLSDPNGLKAGLTGAYNTLYDYYNSEFGKYPDVAGNMVFLSVTSSQADMIDQYNYTSDPTQETGAVGHIWRKIFVTLSNVNNVIQYEPVVEAGYPTETDKCRKLLGQALFLRALCHFDLCRVYAQPYNYTPDASHLGVPVLTITPGPDDNVKRQSVKQVYDRILEDLGEASKLLTDEVAADAHYASLQAVNALYARVFLYMEDWQNALKYAKLTIGDQKLSQGDDYLRLFDDLTYQGEVILRLSGQDLRGGLRSFYETSCVPADTLLSLYDKDDIRLKLLHRKDTVKCIKYQATKIPDNQPTRNDPFVFRLSELYLTAAEAAWNLGQYDVARNYIGAIVSRAVGEQRSNDILSECTDANLIDLIRKERTKELCFEGHQFYDIIRWKQDLVREHKTNSIVKRMEYPNDYFVLPIPQAELNANTNMQPNPTVNKQDS
jgi:hypothetical protein